MKSLQDYINTYRSIATNLNIRGDSAELLIQLLANASYISEVENISYSQEASLEKATLINSKIQHCVNNMYSVFRGQCPRVILNIKPNKPLSFNPFDEVIVGNSYKLYYIGYYKEDESDTGVDVLSYPYDKGLEYSSCTIIPDINIDSTKTYKIVCALTEEKNGLITKSWTIDEKNKYYVDCTNENLSNDLLITVGNNHKDITTDFSEHILNGSIFDLTLPAFGSRLYIYNTNKDTDTNNIPTSTEITAKYLKYSNLSSYNESDLKKMSLSGVEFLNFSSDDNFWENRGLVEFIPGVALVKETPRDSLTSIHYLSNKSRYTNTIFRSNSDLGYLLEKKYPTKIYSGGTKSTYVNGELELYYIPLDTNKYLSDDEIRDFLDNKKSYYVADDILIHKGEEYIASFDIEVDLYQYDDVTDQIKSILDNYNNKFDTNFLTAEELLNNPELNTHSYLREIEALISKIANVKRVRNIGISYYKGGKLIEKDSFSDTGEKYISNDFNNMLSDLQLGAYYKIEYKIKSVIQ